MQTRIKTADDDLFYLTADAKSYNILKEFKKDLIKNSTVTEKLLWTCLRDKKLGVKFRRQHIIGNYIADFICFEKMLIIEVDGQIHKYQIDEDRQRSSELMELGFSILRFNNEEPEQNLKLVLEKIKLEIHRISSSS